MKFFALLVVCLPLVARAEVLQLRGSVVVAQVLTAAAAELKKEANLDLRILTEGGSSPAIGSLVTEEVIDMAISTRPMSAAELAVQPGASFVQTKIGYQVIVFAVPTSLWDGGLRTLNKKQLMKIYEGDTRNWKVVGGPDRPIKYFHRDAERGIWEVFAIWGYGEVRKAPRPRGEILTTSADVLNALKYNTSGISLIELPLINSDVRPLNIELDNGELAAPTVQNVVSHKYPMARPLLLITRGKAIGHVRRLVDFMLSEKGQVFVKQLNHVPLAELNEAPAENK